MKFTDFLNEAMEPATFRHVAVTCTEEEFKQSVAKINWLSGELVDGIAKFFGPECDIDDWIKSNRNFVK
ncbi:hypothetical protein CPT_Merlin166 [Citrobacter phage Merlin]|uniref:Uncharacterized protein n=1 Tax=Citrobacter phage Merlin TaxID=1675602 RepID=A0A0K1LMP7_9CAUD|nr:hypothetical protein CPT_Merlin166 [Citrobacter phage Merlin]AKU43812.1 hypothetical protein CPT_Merlin166 [Citrobacter phage Merlin]